MKLYDYPHQNFGDGPLNTWLWPQLLPTQLNDGGQTLLVGMGPLLNQQLPSAPLKAIFSTGVGYGQAQPDQTWRVYCVRGPISARRLGLDPRLAITDGGVLVRTIGLPSLPKSVPVAYMPHWRGADHGNWRRVCQPASLHYIDPTAGLASILNDIQRSQLLMTEALHGAVVADALRVPWLPVKAYRHILDLKWQDWCGSVGLPYRPAHLPSLYQADSFSEKLHGLQGDHLPAALTGLVLQVGRALARPVYQHGQGRATEALHRLASHATPQLSADQTIDRVTARLQEQLDLLRRDYALGRLSLAGH